MVLKTGRKKEIIEEFKTHETDTGSPEVQIALLTERINEITGHLKTHRKDFTSRRGLLQLVSQRRRHLEYLKSNDSKRYRAILDRLGLRK